MGKTSGVESKARPVTVLPRTRKDDRRIRGQRIDVRIPLVGTFQGQPIQGFMQSVNLSWSGMLLETNFPLNVGDRVVLEFSLPGSIVPVTAPAKVVHKIDEERHDEATWIGVVFENLEPNIQRTLAGFVLERLEAE